VLIIGGYIKSCPKCYFENKVEGGPETSARDAARSSGGTEENQESHRSSGVLTTSGENQSVSRKQPETRIIPGLRCDLLQLDRLDLADEAAGVAG
jgi:hypothetical protein